MTNEEARTILEQMMEGVNPVTGEVFPKEHVCNDAAVIRALYRAICTLDREKQSKCSRQSESRTRSSRANNQNPWTKEEDIYLSNAFRNGATCEEISAELLRSTRSIKHRLVYLGIAGREILSKQENVESGRERQGLPWYPEEDEMLIGLFRSGSSVREIADRMKRSVGGIVSRLEKHGLIERTNMASDV